MIEVSGFSKTYGDTAAVTGGIGGKVWQQAALSPVAAPDHIAPVIGLIEKLEAIFGNRPVDCEFAITAEKDGETLWLLQARPLILSRAPESPAR